MPRRWKVTFLYCLKRHPLTLDLMIAKFEITKETDKGYWIATHQIKRPNSRCKRWIKKRDLSKLEFFFSQEEVIEDAREKELDIIEGCVSKIKRSKEFLKEIENLLKE